MQTQGGRGGPRSVRSGSGDFDSAMPAGRSAPRGGSAGSAPLKPVLTAVPQPIAQPVLQAVPQPIPQPISQPVPQPLHQPPVAPLANGISESAVVPQQQKPAPPPPQVSAAAVAVALAAPHRAQFEAELGSLAAEEHKGRLGAYQSSRQGHSHRD